MHKLVLNKLTSAQLEQFKKNPSHTLIIAGQEGSGKKTIALGLAANLLKVDESKLANATFAQIVSDNESISINEVRKIQNFMKLKTLGTDNIRRIVLVNEAEKLTIEAQNAFLKILEEPPADSLIILLTSSISSLLPTIRSRAQTIYIKPVSKQEILRYLEDEGYKTDEIERAYYISDGRISLIKAILNENHSNTLIKNIAEAKKLLSQSAYERLMQVNDLVKQKSELLPLLKAMESTCYGAVKKTSETGNNNLRRWHESLKLIISTEEQLKKNANTKLLLSNLFIRL